jgi:CubicO group peptidase (beta-lactamase class C family)
MAKRKKVIYITTIIFLLGLGFGIRYGINYAYIGSSFAAKTTCSCLYVSQRPLASIKAEDLYPVSFVNVEVNEKEQSVTTNVYGFAEAKAIFRRGLGCTLVNELSSEEIKQQPALKVFDNVKDTTIVVDTIPEIDYQKLKQTIDATFLEKDSTKIIRTRAVVVFYKGQLVGEQYATGISAQTPLLGWSMTKSVTNAMVGLLVKDGKLDIHKPAPIEEWESDKRREITTDQLLRMSSGLVFLEIYSSPSDATQMLFRKKGAGAFALHSKLGATPNEVWSYSSGTTNILQEIIRRQFRGQQASYLNYPYERLFYKIGMNSAVIEPDASGTYIGSSFMYATARDWARFGQLYLQDGVWNGERILPEGWVKYSATETPKSNGLYGAQFWLDHQDKDFPQDAFMALGFEGQSVTIIPSKQVVVVRLGNTPNEDDFDRKGFIKSIIKAVK